MAGGLIHLWEEWDIQILVILSFILQVILLFFAGIRRGEGSTLWRILLWLAYQMADYTAIYALGHMSISSRSPDQQIVAFWAPFLLLHLGGPDTITAYSFEDNKLWLRHLLTLVGQVTGAVYVLYQYIVATGRNSHLKLAAAAMLMFISGLLKYGERTWALKRASIDSIASSLDRLGDDGHGHRSPYDGRHGTQKLDKEEVLLGAHYVLDICKSLFIDGLRMERYEYEAIARGIELGDGDMYMYELVEMELSLMYDTLYTKAAVIHTWYGCCIRVISPLSAVAAFLLFQFSNKDAYSRADTTITYALFVGALVLELLASIRAAGSSWACASLHARGWDRLCGALMRLRRLLRAGNRRACMDSLGQYNMLGFCTSDDVSMVRGKIAKALGLEDWWNQLHYSTTVSISQDIKAFVLEEIRKRDKEDMRNARGRWILESKEMYRDLLWSVNSIELDQSILVWHLATDLYLYSSASCSDEEEGEADQTIRNTIRVLSNHMLFLLVAHPYLLPGVVHRSRYMETCKYFSKLWLARSTPTDRMNPSTSIKVKKIVEWEPPADSGYDGDGADGRAYIDGTRLAGMLLRNKWNLPMPDMLQVIAGVWVEILFFAAHHCGEESHARKLSSGCEFMTAVWVLMGHATM